MKRRAFLATGLGWAAGAFGQVVRQVVESPKGPEYDLLISTSEDGKTYSAPRLLIQGGAVPTLARDSRGHLVALFQWFPENNRRDYGKIAVRISKDDGDSWDPPRAIRMERLPPSYRPPEEPDLVLLEDGRLRMYFTGNPGATTGRVPTVGTYSAVSDDGVNYDFESKYRFSVLGEAILNATVARLGDEWHLYAPQRKFQQDAYHAVAKDGLNFKREKDLRSFEGEQWMGAVRSVEGGLRFYGAASSGIWWSFSEDGYQWGEPTYTNVMGADPAWAKLSDGREMLIYVGQFSGRAPR